MNSRIKQVSTIVLIFSLFVFISSSNSVAQINTTNDLQFFLATNTEIQFQDFSAVNAPDSSSIGPCLSPVDENSNDVCFSPGDILPGIQIIDPDMINPRFLVSGQDLSGVNNNPPNVLNNEQTSDDIIIEFAPGVTAVGLTLGCLGTVEGCDPTIVLSIRGEDDVLLGTANVDVTSLTDSFIGITSETPIGTIFMDDNNMQVAMSILDIRFGESGITRNVPTLSEWGLIAMAAILGTVGLLVVRRRAISV